VVPKVWIKTQSSAEKGQKMGCEEAIQTEVVHFQCYHWLCVSICRGDSWEKSRLLMLKKKFSACCQKSSTQSNFISYVVWGLCREVFTKLRFWSRSKTFGK